MLGLAITTHLYPRLQPDAYGAGRLTKVRAQAVSGRSCREVAERLGIPERLRNAAPAEFAGPATDQLARTERVLASVIEAVIGACFLAFGYETTAEAVAHVAHAMTGAEPLRTYNCFELSLDDVRRVTKELARHRTPTGRAKVPGLALGQGD